MKFEMKPHLKLNKIKEMIFIFIHFKIASLTGLRKDRFIIQINDESLKLFS